MNSSNVEELEARAARLMREAGAIVSEEDRQRLETLRAVVADCEGAIARQKAREAEAHEKARQQRVAELCEQAKAADAEALEAQGRARAAASEIVALEARGGELVAVVHEACGVSDQAIARRRAAVQAIVDLGGEPPEHRAEPMPERAYRYECVNATRAARNTRKRGLGMAEWLG